MASNLLAEVKFKDVVYNNLSPETRKCLEERIPLKGIVFIKRTANGLAIRTIPDEEKGENPLNSEIRVMMGARKIETELNIFDPFTGDPVQLINPSRIDPKTGPIPAWVEFPRFVKVIEFNMEKHDDRQMVATLYLNESFDKNILDAGKPRLGYNVEYALVDASAIQEEENKTVETESELVLRLMKLEEGKVRLLAKEIGHPAYDTTGIAFLQGWITSRIQSKEHLVTAKNAFAELDVLEMEEFAMSASRKDVIYKDDATKLIRYANKTPLLAYDMNSDNQFKHLAKFFVKGGAEGQKAYQKVKTAVDELNTVFEFDLTRKMDELEQPLVEVDKIKKEIVSK